MAPQRILIVEDERHISKLVKYNLDKEGFTCDTSITGEEALNILDKKEIDLILLDIMLPTIDGLETCRRIRKHETCSSVPVILLTAKGEEVDRIVGFEIGADDYIVKPFSPRELILRVKAVLRRKNSLEKSPKSILGFNDLIVDISRHQVKIKTKEIVLTVMEFQLLTTLLERKGRVQSRLNLLEDVWGIDSEVETRTVDTHIKKLRQKLGKYGKYIETVRGIGYRFKSGD